jgi:Domain of unknown function (DUF1905)/Bacteriocin-protection, YdeI or OmpD-Associated
MSKAAQKHRAPLERFVAVIYKIGILRCVSVPPEVVGAFPPGRTVPVAATVAGRTKRTTLIPAGRGSFRLYIDGAMRKAAGVDSGDPVGVTLRPDRGPRALSVPADFNRALRRAVDARREFAASTPAMRREVLRYIEHAKAPETRARHIANCVRVLSERSRNRRASDRSRGRRRPHS